MLKVVSVSLGSSARDKTSRASFLGNDVELSRVGTDGDFPKAMQLIAELDGKVDAIGLGGIDLYLCAGRKKWAIRDALKLARQAKSTPVVDGSILKMLLEPQMVRWLAALGSGPENPPPLKGAKALLVSGVDRFGMATALAESASEIVFGDMMFALGIPIAIHKISRLQQFANVLAPIVTRLPFQVLYPTGEKQKEHKPKFTEYFNWADWICGDFHYISRNLPPRLDGKVVLTNTTTEKDQERLKSLGLAWLITTTPVIEGRSFGMNVLEGCIAALIRSSGDLISDQNYEVYLNKLDLKPTMIRLN